MASPVIKTRYLFYNQQTKKDEVIFVDEDGTRKNIDNIQSYYARTGMFDGLATANYAVTPPDPDAEEGSDESYRTVRFNKQVGTLA